MSYQILVGLYVTDDRLYSEYRDAMTPILESYGGGFGYDLKVSQVLKSETSEPINRVFTIVFEDRASKKDFFSDPAYLKIKNKYFEPSVSHTTLIADYELA
jgi:uncharacterized protein (DUF1330 family)